MTKVLGLSAFGLRDCFAKDNKTNFEGHFHLSHVLLPSGLVEKIRSGKHAEEDRTHTGLHWPIESRIKSGDPLRRVPVSYAWRALVEAKDRTGRWNIGRGISFPLAKIIASHTADLIIQASEESSEFQSVLTIPNHLDEYGQESLLKELAAQGHRNTWLLWRPVAAALSWLDQVGGDFIPERMHDDDHIHVIYMGSDAIEMTTLRLRHRQHNGLNYILPLRDRPKNLPECTGLDWVGNLINSIMPGMDNGAFWQFFSLFPDIWKAIAGMEADTGDTCRLLNLEDSWRLWVPPSDMKKKALNIIKGECRELRQLLAPSCGLSQMTKNEHSESVNQFLQKQISQMIKKTSSGKLRGMIVTGPLAEEKIPPWLETNIALLRERGLKYSGNLSIPEIDKLWICSKGNNLLAEGAAIYGNRILEGIPAYLDTMPQVSILAKEQSQFKWVPLLNAQEVLGGQEHTERIPGKFQLGQGQNKLDSYLYKGPIKEAEKIMEKSQNPLADSPDNIPSCQARLIRHFVRSLGSLKKVKENSFFNYSGIHSAYGLSYAHALYTEESEGKSTGDSNFYNKNDLSRLSFRLARINFLSAPTEDVALDIEVRMRPASGLARIEILPEKPDFLHGRKVRLDFGKMNPPESLPKFSRGWPGVQEIVVDPEDNILKNSENLIKRFESISPLSDGYKSMIDSIRDNVLKKPTLKTFPNHWFNVQTLDEKGQACTQKGNDILERIGVKLKNDFQNYPIKKQQKNFIFSRAAWLYWRTPDIIVDYIKEVMNGDYTQNGWLWSVDAASRCFRKIQDYHDLFKSISRRINGANNHNNQIEPFPMQSTRAIWRVLMLRKDGEKGLDCNLARLFAGAALKRLYEEQCQENFSRLYFQLIRLLLYLLRYRKTNPDCFAPNDSKSMEVFEKAMDSMKKAKKYCNENGDLTKALMVERVAVGFKRYLYYEGSEDLLPLLNKEAGGID